MNKKTKSELIYVKQSYQEFIVSERKLIKQCKENIQLYSERIDFLNKELERRALDL